MCQVFTYMRRRNKFKLEYNINDMTVGLYTIYDWYIYPIYLSHEVYTIIYNIPIQIQRFCENIYHLWKKQQFERKIRIIIKYINSEKIYAKLPPKSVIERKLKFYCQILYLLSFLSCLFLVSDTLLIGIICCRVYANKREYIHFSCSHVSLCRNQIK